MTAIWASILYIGSITINHNLLLLRTRIYNAKIWYMCSLMLLMHGTETNIE